MAVFNYNPPLKINLQAEAVVKRCEETLERTGQNRLLPQQISALQFVRGKFDSNPNVEVAIVSMPTGSGKTGVIACLPYYLATIKSCGSKESQSSRYPFDKPILVIAPNLDILDQLKQELTVKDEMQKQPFLIRMGIVSEKERAHLILPAPLIIVETSDLHNQNLQTYEIVLANAQKFLKNNWEKNLKSDLFRLVIVDEAHHHPAPTWRRIVEKFRSPECPVVFFTATPYRTDGQPVIPQTESCIEHHLSLNDAVKDGMIRKTVFEELAELKEPERILTQDSTTRPDEDTKRMTTILHKVKKLLDDKRSLTKSAVPEVPHMAIAIAKNTNRADHLLILWRNLFPEEPAESYYSQKKPHEQDAIMKKLKKNELSLVIVVGMLLEGFDHPPISIAAITYSIKSPLRFAQFIGRAQRIYRQDAYTDTLPANIVTHKDYKQRQNNTNFETEAFIPQTENENVDEN